MACAPRKRSDMLRSRWRTALGVLAGPRSTGMVRSRSSGNSARTSPATQPSPRIGSAKSSSGGCSTTQGVLAAAGQRVEFAPQMDGVGRLRPDERLAHPPAPRGQRDLGADGHVVEVGQHAVAVVADGEAPAVGADRPPQVVAIALDGHGGELDVRVGGADALEDVELVDAAPAARGEEGQRHRAALGQLADVEDPGAADLARVALARRGPLRLARGDVRVAVEPARGQRRREGGELVSHARAGGPLVAAVADGVERDVREQEDDHHADEPAVSAGARGARDPRLPAHARARRSRGRGSDGTCSRRAPRSASTRTAGSTTRTPSSDTVRSTTVTQPKSRSMRMSDTARTAKPAIAVTPLASTAAPVERYVRAIASRSPYPAARSWRKRSLSRTLNSVEIAMTSAPSVTDIGLRSMRSAKSRSADQPVASAIGTSGTRARRGVRRAAKSTSATASRPATSVPKRRHVEATFALASAASTGSPASSALTPGGGSSWSRMSSTTAFCLASGMSRMPKARLATVRSRVMTACEK